MKSTLKLLTALTILLFCHNPAADMKAQEYLVFLGNFTSGTDAEMRYNPALATFTTVNLQEGDVIRVTLQEVNTNGSNLYIKTDGASINTTTALASGTTEVRHLLTQAQADKIKEKGLYVKVVGGGKAVRVSVVKSGTPDNEYALHNIQTDGNLMFPGYVNQNYMYGIKWAGLQAKDTLCVACSSVQAGDEIYIDDIAWNSLGIPGNLSPDAEGNAEIRFVLTAEQADYVTDSGIIFQRKGGCTYKFERFFARKYYDKKPVREQVVIWSGSSTSSVDFRYSDNLAAIQAADLQPNDTLVVYIDGAHEGDKLHVKECGSWSALNSNDVLTEGQERFLMTLTSTEVDKIKANKMIIQQQGQGFTITKVCLHKFFGTIVTIPSARLATYSNLLMATDFTKVAGLKAYSGTLDNDDHLVAAPVSVAVNAGNAVILLGESAGDYAVPYVDEGADIDDNVLKPTDGGSVTGYVLGNTATYGVGMYLVTGKTVASGKAYVPYVASGAKRLVLSFQDIPSAVSPLEIDKTSPSCTYNILGQKVKADAKGLVIRNGKLFINK